METANLKEYLGIALDMEKNIFLRQKLIDSLTSQRDRLCVPQKFQAPVKPREQKRPLPPPEPVAETIAKDEKPKSGGMKKVPNMAGTVFCLFWFGNSLSAAWNVTKMESSIVVCFIVWCFALCLGCVPLILWIYPKWKKQKKQQEQEETRRKEQEAKREEQEMIRRQKYAQEIQRWQTAQLAAANRYNQELAEYRRNVAGDQARILTESRPKSLLCQEIEELNKHQTESKTRLSEIYEKNIVFPKYRNLVALSSLYEYICAGRCDALEGHEGGYNIYETEVRLDRIVTQLDMVIARLDAIRNNQFVLFSAIQEINQQCAGILDGVRETNRQGARILETVQTMSDTISMQMDGISMQMDGMKGQTEILSSQLLELQKNSALAAYHAERTQKELAYMNRMDYLSGRNDGVFFNLPPV